MKKTRWILLLSALVIAILAITFFLRRPDPIESTSLRYWAWRHGLVKMDSDRALEEMVYDPHRDDIVIGSTEPELIRKFGYVLPVEQASSYVQYCYNNYDNDAHRVDKVFMLRRSNWMVLMKGGKAVELLRVSGC